jgi:acyl dehydratase
LRHAISVQSCGPNGRRDVVEWFEDLAIGVRFKNLEKVLTREDIKRFAAEFDPQPYHLDASKRACRFGLTYRRGCDAAGD